MAQRTGVTVNFVRLCGFAAPEESIIAFSRPGIFVSVFGVALGFAATCAAAAAPS